MASRRSRHERIRALLAEVADKEPTITAIWCIATFFCVIGFLLCHQRARGEMAQSLIDRAILRGKTKTEVLTLLGPPDSTLGREIDCIVDVGTRFCGGPWTYRLQVHFEEAADKVKDVWLMD